MAKCTFLGLGVMGAPMAGFLVKAGHEVTVWNRTAAKSETWLSSYSDGKASMAQSAAEAVAGADCVLSCLGDDPDVKVVYEAIMSSVTAGQVYIDHTTASAELARSLQADLASQGAMFVDAPVSGGQAGAENGQLTIMCGGEDAAFAKAEPIMQAFAKQITHIGGPGAGQQAKMVNQICIAGIVQGLSEGLAFAQNAGLDPAKVIEAISKGAAQSWQMENRWQTMVEGKFDYGFAIDWMRKDLRIALDEARANGSTLPVAALVDQFYADVQAAGGNRWDTSSLITLLKK
ncbi:NAD(P)-dependent oxidoreductase [Ponticaulis sp.]|uniref:NAD(P)-dependent oxidoreductase n=1 Tax=Ponticaulis sp. TaxID=2020902 RepID=UPI000B62965C|nr:NAD(P)-dependent oxidoreductase [Ponticaulis sp.]MAI89653.1 oxidoreductase [Ponticaulis sp.]OUY00673.1 MAG: oxidoreductase [Hyphomonadaceae bacterium TMED5]|tara:strand:+ start:138144 stop:139010 length:867 start_codon:yes stop_codon:yes gene_type:complete